MLRLLSLILRVALKSSYERISESYKPDESVVSKFILQGEMVGAFCSIAWQLPLDIGLHQKKRQINNENKHGFTAHQNNRFPPEREQ